MISETWKRGRVFLPWQQFTCKMAETTNAGMNQHVKATLEMKQRAVKYYNDNGVPKCLESLLNSMFLDEPDDVYGYMVNKGCIVFVLHGPKQL